MFGWGGGVEGGVKGLRKERLINIEFYFKIIFIYIYIYIYKVNGEMVQRL